MTKRHKGKNLFRVDVLWNPQIKCSFFLQKEKWLQKLKPKRKSRNSSLKMLLLLPMGQLCSDVSFSMKSEDFFS